MPSTPPLSRSAADDHPGSGGASLQIQLQNASAQKRARIVSILSQEEAQPDEDQSSEEGLLHSPSQERNMREWDDKDSTDKHQADSDDDVSHGEAF